MTIDENPIRFEWYVDQDGYSIEPALGRSGEPTGRVCPRGGPRRYYRPLDDDGLWRRFGETCTSPEGVLEIVHGFGMLSDGAELLDVYLSAGRRLRGIAERLDSGDRLAAGGIFLDRRDDPFTPPQMDATLVLTATDPPKLEWRLIPHTLRDALLHQAAEAITENRRYRRCRYEGCANWFRLGRRAAIGGKRQTYTVRREFCSDRCRVASARQQKREAANHA